MTARFPKAYRELFKPSRYKVYYGGRGSAKSHSFAAALLIMGAQRKLRILCCREFMQSMADSVHKLLADKIDELGLSSFYEVQKTTIKGANGTEFMFKGLKHSVQEIKSTEGVDICWVEEAQGVSEASWEVLVPTIRAEGSEIWISFNPKSADDPTYQRFIVKAPAGSIVRKVNWDSNPWFPATLDAERRHMLETDPDGYAHIWDGNVVAVSDAIVFRGKWQAGAFEPPAGARLRFGADWGFSQDPTVLVRCWEAGGDLWIDHEAYGVGVDFGELPALFDTVPGSRQWPIYADCARPETISWMARQGFRISAASKWSGAVEDGIAHLKGYKNIHIHERCKHAMQEAALYSYRVDKNTKEPLPEILDKNNHIWDAVRYSLNGVIKKPGTKAKAVRLNYLAR